MLSYRDKAFLIEPIPSHLVVPEFGLMMKGDEPDLIRGLQLAYTSVDAPDDRPFTYCEVGVASGKTLAAMTQIIHELTDGNWKAFGVDIKNGWSLQLMDVWKNVEGRDDKVYIRLCGSEQFFRENEDPLDFVLIDGCHEYECVKIDFEGAAKSVPIGGIIAFHDSDEVAQGVHLQPHKGELIGVRRALFDLNLLPKGDETWKLLADIEADPDNHGVVLIQRIQAD